MAKKKEIDKFIKQLLRNKIDYYDIPEDITDDDEFILKAKDNGIISFARRGYDVINNNFFVEQYINDGDRSYNEGLKTFKTFEEYYNLLKGDIYDNSCYYQYRFSSLQVKEYGLDIERLNADHFIDYTIDDWTCCVPSRDKNDDDEDNKIELIKWLDKFLKCSNGNDFYEMRVKFAESGMGSISLKDNNLFIMDQFIVKGQDKAFDIMIDSCNIRDDFYIAKLLVVRYGYERVIALYNPRTSERMITKRKNYLRSFAEKLASKHTIKREKGFSKITHTFYVRVKHIFEDAKRFNYEDVHFFMTFDEFAAFVNNYLSGSNLLGAKLDMDFSSFVVDEKTKLPQDTNRIIFKTITKVDETFIVTKKWYDNKRHLIDEKEEAFKFFADFAYFLNYDLSGTDFLLCDGIINLNDISGLKLEKCRFKSDFLDKFGIKYEKVKVPILEDLSFEISVDNEDSTELVFQHNNSINLPFHVMQEFNKLFYISDIHLMHRFSWCKTEDDREYVIEKIAKLLSPNRFYFRLVGGDVSSEYKYYQRLIEQINHYNKFDREHLKDIFILGNHELWSFPDKTFEEIVEIYREEVKWQGCYFIQNSIVYQQSDDIVGEIDEQTLSDITVQELRDKLKKAQLIIFGGLAFSGLNDKFNADTGIYRGIITREQEKIESKKFEALYRKVCHALADKNVVIFTHTPKDDWTTDDYMPNFVYVSGHSHKNYFYDDGITRIYADNQVGYKRKDFSLKYFFIEKEYDYFADYEDGIYEISKDEYVNFYRAKNIEMDYNRKGTVIMLKRNDYYCFFFKGKTRNSMLNGGALKRAPFPIEYYYDRMLDEIAFIKRPLDKYTAIQEKISKQVEAIGGSGKIHGAIIDIDFMSHIYVNPKDLKITAYFAYDMVYKKVYKNIPSLLKDKCPILYSNYEKLIAKKEDNALVEYNNAMIDTRAEYYLDTDIYWASREIKKMQRVSKGILGTWFDPDFGKLLLK